jgi:hypothetical protein
MRNEMVTMPRAIATFQTELADLRKREGLGVVKVILW